MGRARFTPTHVFAWYGAFNKCPFGVGWGWGYVFVSCSGVGLEI